MTAGQSFHEGFDERKCAIGESKNMPLVIQFTRKISTIPYLEAVDLSAPALLNTRHDAPADGDLPSFPGVSWFGG